MSIESAIQWYDQHRDTFLEQLKTFLRFETISAQSAHDQDIADCAAWLRDFLNGAGLQARIMPTKGHPVVYADSGPTEPADALTILLYGHYDVQPPGELELWDSPPFEPTIRNGTIFARGSTDDKGQMMTHLAALKSLHETSHHLSIRIKCLYEGEEETGSPHLAEFVKEHAKLLACDYVLLSDTTRFDDTTPAIAYASRGLVYKEITLQGPARDLHSGVYGGAVANPANVLAGIIASLHDADGRVTIPGFYDDVRPLTQEERDWLAQTGLTEAEMLAKTGSPAATGEPGFSAAARCTARPSLDVNGLLTGYTAEGAATIIPSTAMAKVSMRLVAHQDPEKISAAFDRAVRAVCPPTVKLSIQEHSHSAAYVGATDSPGMRAAVNALTAGYGRPPVMIREGGTLPILPMFKQVLGADSLMVGFADPDSNLHSPNEFFHIRNLEQGTRCILRLLDTIA